jgi:hypothetical protein
MPDTKELLHSNLHEVFSQRDPERRRVAIERTYTDDVRFIDPEGEFVGRQALSDQAQKLLDGVLAGSEFEEDGPRYIGTDTGALAWRVGPSDNPIVRGIDVLTIRDGRVSVLRTLIAADADEWSRQAPVSVQGRLGVGQGVAQLGPRHDPEFREDPVEVGADGAMGEEEALRDLAVRQPTGRQLCNLEFLRG